MNDMQALNVKLIETPSGEEVVMMSRASYDQLRDQADAYAHTQVLRAVEAGDEEVLSSDEMMALLDAPSPLAFWRNKRGLTQNDLGVQIGVSQSYIASLEKGRRKGDPVHFLKLAQVLNVSMEDLVVG
jgi:DNA-binding XRE family transcriptional regulator